MRVPARTPTVRPLVVSLFLLFFFVNHSYRRTDTRVNPDPRDLRKYDLWTPTSPPVSSLISTRRGWIESRERERRTRSSVFEPGSGSWVGSQSPYCVTDNVSGVQSWVQTDYPVFFQFIYEGGDETFLVLYRHGPKETRKEVPGLQEQSLRVWTRHEMEESVTLGSETRVGKDLCRPNSSRR